MNRRNFIQKSCTACIGLAGMGYLLQGCASGLPVFTSTLNKKNISVPLSKFSEFKTNLLLVRNSGLEFDILLVKKGEAYKALSMECTHQSASLTPTSTKIICSAHGSVFDLDGNVLKEPALQPLHQFKTSVNDQVINIYLN